MTLPKHDFMISWFSAWNFFLILLVHWTYFSFSAQRQFRHHPLPSIIGDCPLAPSPLWYLAFLYILIDHRCSFLYAFLHLPYYQPNGVCSVASVPLRHITMPFLCPGTHSKCHMFTTKRVSLFPGIYNTDKLSTKKQRKTNKKKKKRKSDIHWPVPCKPSSILILQPIIGQAKYLILEELDWKIHAFPSLRTDYIKECRHKK